MTKTLVLALLIGVAWWHACAAATPEIVPASGLAILADWQYPEIPAVAIPQPLQH